ncbi:NdvB protein [Alkalimonas sp. NCh-2]|uniref:GH36-type glycosyl hydrolase domain-containing protein n=1 Tax=Alkalimonas sp. NCh-2 TaxID=3144846 RepID=UPI0031F676C9
MTAVWMQPAENEQRYDLFSPVVMPLAAAFLWNKHLMVQLNCRGYATAQFMQPEPAKYAHAPNLEAKTFMQPEQPYYAHHPGRFVYIKDEQTGDIFSIPYEPVRSKADRFVFSAGKSDIRWQLEQLGLQLEWQLSLSPDQPHELWQLTVTNLTGVPRQLSVYPYFPVGYMSWMNQSARFEPALSAIVCSSVTPYQQYPDYFKNKHLKDKTFLLAEQQPDSWQCAQQAFEGEGGLHAPDALQQAELDGGDALYETPACVMQYRLQLAGHAQQQYRFVFGPALDEAEIAAARQRYFLTPDGFTKAQQQYSDYIAQGQGCLQIETPDAALNNFVNHWLPRQVYYHGDVNRLTTDPQTRNYLQDNMGMSYVRPAAFRTALLTALAQQHSSGEMPDGILLHPDAELKYINQVPHTDQCVWLPVCLTAYLAETNDYALLEETVAFSDSTEPVSVFEHLCRAMSWLLHKRDARGLSFIEQGDWCDPMNMVGYKGHGVSGWLSLAAAYALNCWAAICQQLGEHHRAEHYRADAERFNQVVNHYLWDGKWYGRGITDDKVLFGVSKDAEGRIYLNPQSWAMLSGAANAEQVQLMLHEIDEQLNTPFGVQMLAPAYTAMRDDVGRVTQKHPGSAENGSVYNHAAAFYLYALYQVNQPDKAYQVLRQMLPGSAEQDYLQRGQLPVFIPNYYRGAYQQFPRTAGRSSQLFNTGTVHWVYRSLIEGLFGVKGCPEGLSIQPQLPAEWPEVKLVRQFRGATFHILMRRQHGINQMQLTVDGQLQPAPLITDIMAGQNYQVDVLLPMAHPQW